MQNYEMYDGLVRQLNEVNYEVKDLKEAINNLIMVVGVVLLKQQGLNLEDLFKAEERKVDVG